MGAQVSWGDGNKQPHVLHNREFATDVRLERGEGKHLHNKWLSTERERERERERGDCAKQPINKFNIPKLNYCRWTEILVQHFTHNYHIIVATVTDDTVTIFFQMYSYRMNELCSTSDAVPRNQ